MEKKKILIIDDEPLIGEVVKDFLDDQKRFTAFVASSAPQGLEMVKKEKPDLVLLDILMPEISGLECLGEIKKINPETVVVVVTGLRDEGVAKDAVRKGAYDYVVKPFNLDYLQNNILDRVFPPS